MQLLFRVALPLRFQGSQSRIKGHWALEVDLWILFR
jgi:hypothetical protein